jgi:type I restriction enzyme S subunit
MAQEPSARYLMNLQRPLVRHFDLIAQAPGGMARLRELILTLAVQGKLVPQDPSETPVDISVIPSAINRLIGEGKVPRSRTSADVEQGRAFDELPNGWVAVAASKVFVPRSGNSKLIKGKLFPESAEHLYPGYSASGQDVWLSDFEYEGTAVILSAVGARCGKAFLARGKWSAIANTHIIWPLLDLVLPEYSMLILNNEDYWIRSGGAQPFVKVTETLQQQVFLPPLAEQSRIITRVDELMQLCDALEAQGQLEAEQHARLVSTLFSSLLQSDTPEALADNWQRIATHFDLLLDRPEAVDALEQTILQLAVRGLLVPQDPTDEPASVLLKKVRAEKDQLISEGKIKRDKHLPLIENEKRPFVLPRGWSWARFPELGEFGRGKSKHRPRNDPALFNPPQYPLIQTGEVSRANGIVSEVHSYYSPLGLAQSRMWPKGTLCITIAANIAESAVLGFDACFPDSVVGFIPAPALGSIEYFLLFVETARADLYAFAPATAQKNINLEILGSLLVPIPPLNELTRIVTRVNELRAMCADLRTKLTEQRSTASNLAEALIDGA